MIGNCWYEESERNWDSAILAEVNATWQYDMLSGMTVMSLDIVCLCAVQNSVKCMNLKTFHMC